MNLALPEECVQNWDKFESICSQAVITGLVQMTDSNSMLLVPVLEAISNITAQDAGQVRQLTRQLTARNVSSSCNAASSWHSEGHSSSLYTAARVADLPMCMPRPLVPCKC